jgi:branched-subunit amino acid transport protein
MMIGMILGMACVTFLSRFLPMALLSKWSIPETVKQGLEYIPVGILSAIVFPILFSGKTGALEAQPQLLLAALPVFLFSWKVRSVWGSVILGMAIYWGLGAVL